MNKHYYFFRNRIVSFNTKLIAAFNSAYVELTPEQVEFYLAHPEASVEEVRNCQLYEPYVEPTPELEELRDNAKRELMNAYCLKMGRYSEIDVALAVASRICIQNVWLTQSNCAYTNDEAKEIIKGFVQLGKSAKAIYEESITAIDNSMSEDTIESTLTTYKSRIEAL